jgi:hypothetical protein
MMRGDPSTVLDDPRLADLGVAPPSIVRLQRAVSEAGLSLPSAVA